MTDTAISTLKAPAAKTATGVETPAATGATTRSGERNLAVSYLRAFVTLLVLAHHAFIGYMGGLPKTTTFAKPPFTWGAFPIQDSHSFAPFGLLVGVNDTFFMSLMFFISGLFVWDSLKRKGAGGFVRDRVIRLGIPFAVAAGLLAPLAYYPSYLATGADPSVGAYVDTWLNLGGWVSGPAWFIWLLLAFGLVTAGVYRLAPTAAERLGRFLEFGKTRPLLFAAGLIGVTAVAYLSLDLFVGPIDWWAWGPFSVQVSRLLHYAAYFAIGAGVGAVPLSNGLLAPDGGLQRRWRSSFGIALAAFVVATVVLVVSGLGTGAASLGALAANGLCYVTCCAALSLAWTGLFVHVVRKRSAVWDSLSANAYGMYLVHYVFVTWVQYALLRSALPGLSKGLMCLAAVVALSWATTALIRRIPLVARVI